MISLRFLFEKGDIVGHLLSKFTSVVNARDEGQSCCTERFVIVHEASTLSVVQGRLHLDIKGLL